MYACAYLHIRILGTFPEARNILLIMNGHFAHTYEISYEAFSEVRNWSISSRFYCLPCHCHVRCLLLDMVLSRDSLLLLCYYTNMYM